jgi:hypothetical protein
VALWRDCESVQRVEPVQRGELTHRCALRGLDSYGHATTE